MSLRVKIGAPSENVHVPKTWCPRHQYVVGNIFDIVGNMYPRYVCPKTSKNGKMFPTTCTQDMSLAPTTSKNVPTICTHDMVPTGHSYDIKLHSKTSIVKFWQKILRWSFDVVGNMFDVVGHNRYRGVHVVGTIFDIVGNINF